MSDSLDDRLRNLKVVPVYTVEKDAEKRTYLDDVAIAQIKQCFLEQGWKEPDEQDPNA